MSSNKTRSDVPVIEPGLDTEPRENLENWLSAIGDAARSYCSKRSPLGALHLACTDEVWNALHPPAAGGAPTPRPTHPQPAPLTGVETGAARAVQVASELLYQDYADAEATLRLALLKSIGQTNRRAITSRITVLHHLTSNDIIAHMVARHGVRTEKDLVIFRALLDVTLTSIDQFDAHTIEFETNVENLVSTDPASVYRAYLLYTKILITPSPAFASHISLLLHTSSQLLLHTKSPVGYGWAGHP